MASAFRLVSVRRPTAIPRRDRSPTTSHGRQRHASNANSSPALNIRRNRSTTIRPFWAVFRTKTAWVQTSTLAPCTAPPSGAARSSVPPTDHRRNARSLVGEIDHGLHGSRQLVRPANARQFCAAGLDSKPIILADETGRPFELAALESES